MLSILPSVTGVNFCRTSYDSFSDLADSVQCSAAFDQNGCTAGFDTAHNLKL